MVGAAAVVVVGSAEIFSNLAINSAEFLRGAANVVDDVGASDVFAAAADGVIFVAVVAATSAAAVVVGGGGVVVVVGSHVAPTVAVAAAAAGVDGEEGVSPSGNSGNNSDGLVASRAATDWRNKTKQN